MQADKRFEEEDWTQTYSVQGVSRMMRWSFIQSSEGHKEHSCLAAFSITTDNTTH